VSQINCCQWIQRRPKAALEFPTASSPLTIWWSGWRQNMWELTEGIQSQRS
jgi:hypothetical protein